MRPREPPFIRQYPQRASTRFYFLSNIKNEDSKGKKKKKQNMNELLLKDKGKGIEFNRKRNEQILGVNLMSREGNSPRK